jgi:hypothetical protein
MVMIENQAITPVVKNEKAPPGHINPGFIHYTPCDWTIYVYSSGSLYNSLALYNSALDAIAINQLRKPL